MNEFIRTYNPTAKTRKPPPLPTTGFWWLLAANPEFHFALVVAAVGLLADARLPCLFPCGRVRVPDPQKLQV